MNTRSRRPIGVVSSSVAALLFAAPTLLFPADAPTGPRLVIAAIGAVFLVLGVVRVRREPAEPDAAGTRWEDQPSRPDLTGS